MTLPVFGCCGAYRCSFPFLLLVMIMAFVVFMVFVIMAFVVFMVFIFFVVVTFVVRVVRVVRVVLIFAMVMTFVVRVLVFLGCLSQGRIRRSDKDFISIFSKAKSFFLWEKELADFLATDEVRTSLQIGVMLVAVGVLRGQLARLTRGDFDKVFVVSSDTASDLGFTGQPMHL